LPEPFFEATAVFLALLEAPPAFLPVPGLALEADLAGADRAALTSRFRSALAAGFLAPDLAELDREGGVRFAALMMLTS
jgi:hypothetical protein